jgi:2-haloacid dehalogenase
LASEPAAPSRREFLGLAAASLVVGQGAVELPKASVPPGAVEAIAFDALTVFDPSAVVGVAEAVFPGQGAALAAAWRTRQFEYTWLRTAGGRYVDFRSVTADALVFAARAMKLDLTSARHDRLMEGFLAMKAYPEAPAVLRALRQSGWRLGFLTNMTEAMVDAAVRDAQLEGVFDHILSTDRVRAYKPDPRAYRMGVEAFGVAPEAIVFAAFAGWDAVGAQWFGYRTFWVNRAGAPREQLGIESAGAGRDLQELASFLNYPSTRGPLHDTLRG